MPGQMMGLWHWDAWVFIEWFERVLEGVLKKVEGEFVGGNLAWVRT